MDGGHMQRVPASEVEALGTSAWIVLRYWIDYLVESHDVREIEPAHLDELVRHFEAVIGPHLTPAARRSLAAES